MAWDKIENGSTKALSRILCMAWDKIENGSINQYQQDYKYGLR